MSVAPVLIVRADQIDSGSTHSTDARTVTQEQMQKCLTRGKNYETVLLPYNAGFVCVKDKVPDGPIVKTDLGGHLLSVGEMSNGKMNGQWTRYYSNGNKMDQGVWENEIPNGEWSFYYENGSIKESGRMEKGERVGSWHRWDPDGKEDGQTLEDSLPWFALGEISGVYRSEDAKSWMISGEAAWTPRLVPSRWLPWKLKLLGRLSFSWFTKQRDAGGLPSVGYSLAIEKAVLSNLKIQLALGGKTMVGINTAPEVGVEFIFSPEHWGIAWLDGWVDGLILRESLFFPPSVPFFKETVIGVRIK